jgi:serine/threonine protein kinase
VTGKSAADVIIERYFLRPDGPYGHYRMPGQDDLNELGQEVLRDALYRYELVRVDDDERVMVQLYLGVSESGGWLWEQELRTLLRVGSLRHLALPEVVAGGHWPAAPDASEPGFAYVVTKGNGGPLSEEPDAPTIMKQRPVEALRALSVLADALAKLHAMGIIHRNLWPGTIEITGDPESSLPPSFRLVRFEMSRMVENLLQGGIAESAQRTSEIRRQLIAKDKRALAYCPPERVQFLFPEGDELTAFGESERSDVYGLGVIAYEWFVGPVPFDPDALGDLNDHKRVRDAVASLNATMRQNIRLAGQTLDAELRRMLESMLEPHVMRVIQTVR